MPLAWFRQSESNAVVMETPLFHPKALRVVIIPQCLETGVEILA
jgi:hypothetical protein